MWIQLENRNKPGERKSEDGIGEKRMAQSTRTGGTGEAEVSGRFEEALRFQRRSFRRRLDPGNLDSSTSSQKVDINERRERQNVEEKKKKRIRDSLFFFLSSFLFSFFSHFPCAPKTVILLFFPRVCLLLLPSSQFA